MHDMHHFIAGCAPAHVCVLMRHVAAVHIKQYVRSSQLIGFVSCAADALAARRALSSMQVVSIPPAISTLPHLSSL